MKKKPERRKEASARFVRSQEGDNENDDEHEDDSRETRMRALQAVSISAGLSCAILGSFRCASLPFGSFEAPRSYLLPHPKLQGLRRLGRAAQWPWRYNRWAAHRSR